MTTSLDQQGQLYDVQKTKSRWFQANCECEKSGKEFCNSACESSSELKILKTISDDPSLYTTHFHVYQTISNATKKGDRIEINSNSNSSSKITSKSVISLNIECEREGERVYVVKIFNKSKKKRTQQKYVHLQTRTVSSLSRGISKRGKKKDLTTDLRACVFDCDREPYDYCVSC